MSGYINTTLSWDDSEVLRLFVSTLGFNKPTTGWWLVSFGIFAGAAAFITGWGRRWRKTEKGSEIRRVTVRWRDILKSTSHGDLLLQGYNSSAKTDNKAFIVKGTTFLPPSLFQEARKLPSNVLSFDVAIEETLMLRFSLGEKHSEHLQIIAHDLARNLNSQIEPLCDEITRAFDEILLPAHSKPEVDGEWHAVIFHPRALRMLGIIVSRAFVGEELCRDERFTKTIASFANGVIIQFFILQIIPGEYLKSQLAKIMPQRRRVAALREMVRKPVLGRLEDIENNTVNPDDHTLMAKIVDMVVSKYYPKTKIFDEATKEGILKVSSTRLLALMFGAIDTTTMALCHIVYDLIGHPKAEYADQLCEEVNGTLEKNGGKWDVTAINELKLLDSFIKESQRLHSVGFSLGARKVVKQGGIQFSNGDFVPEGHTVSHPLYAVHRDPNNYVNPFSFDGFRFARGQDDQPKAISGPQISDQFLTFGYGRYACPGRAFALVVLKLMMIRLLTKYDFKEIERPKDWYWGNGLLPDMKAKVLMKMASANAGI